MSRILEMFGLRAVKPYKTGHGSIPGLPNVLVGIECEIENWEGDWHEVEFGGIQFTEDGSLRNNGVEAITLPMTPGEQIPLLNAFFSRYRIKPDNYSERCSTHVHVNAQDMTPEQINTVCLTYQTVERLLFDFIGHDRMNNIFCVPWHQSGLTYTFANKVTENPLYAFRQWQKYSALNLIPLTTLGTMEFRHLHGTCDIVLIEQWLCLITRLFEFAKTRTLDSVKEQILYMNTTSNYREWMYNVFDRYADLLLSSPGYDRSLSKGVVDSKLMLSTNENVIKKVDLGRFGDGRVEQREYDRALRRYADMVRQNLPVDAQELETVQLNLAAALEDIELQPAEPARDIPAPRRRGTVPPRNPFNY